MKRFGVLFLVTFLLALPVSAQQIVERVTGEGVMRYVIEDENIEKTEEIIKTYVGEKLFDQYYDEGWSEFDTENGIIFWKFDDITYTLYISGDGILADIPYNEWPWYEHAVDVEHVVFDGFSYLMYDIFGCNYGYCSEYTRMQTITFPVELKYIDPIMFGYLPVYEYIMADGGEYYVQEGVLYQEVNGRIYLVSYPHNRYIYNFYIPEGVNEISSDAFLGSRVENIIFPESLDTIQRLSVGSCSIKTIYIPANVTNIYREAFAFSDSLEAINVAEDNMVYMSVDGVLFTKDMKSMVAYPCGRQSIHYSVPDGVINIPFTILSNVMGLKSIYIPASVELIDGNYGLWYTDTSLAEVVVDPQSMQYASVDGVLYNKEISLLLWYPSGKMDYRYVIPETVTQIENVATFYNKYLVAIYLNHVKTIMSDNFEGFARLKYVYLWDNIPENFNSAFSQYKDTILLCYPDTVKGWESPTMNIYGVVYNTAMYFLSKGDIDGDFSINRYDLYILQQSFSGYPTEIDESAVDLDGNGKLTRKDVMILARYLAGWDGYDKYFS